jgi:hypothetical protein
MPRFSRAYIRLSLEINFMNPDSTPAPREEKDPLLVSLVNHANAHPEDRTPITLQIKGLLVTGRLIAGDVYFELFARKFTKGASEEVAEANYKIFNSYGDKYRAQREDDTIKRGETTYIHLIDCEILTPSNMTQLSALWRGKIAEVDGFLLGRLAPKAPVAPAS